MSEISSAPPSPVSCNTATSGNAPRYGVLVPNRVFVGGIASNTTETELQELFSQFGNIKEIKIISDRSGVCKGYGFITFETEEEAKKVQHQVRFSRLCHFHISKWILTDFYLFVLAGLNSTERTQTEYCPCSNETG